MRSPPRNVPSTWRHCRPRSPAAPGRCRCASQANFSCGRPIAGQFREPRRTGRGEIARIDGSDVEAMRSTNRPSLGSRNGFIHMRRSPMNWLPASTRAWLRKIARVYLQDARYGYLRWGADGKVRATRTASSALRDAPVPASPTTTIGAPLEQLDVGTVVKASQACRARSSSGILLRCCSG